MSIEARRRYNRFRLRWRQRRRQPGEVALDEWCQVAGGIALRQGKKAIGRGGLAAVLLVVGAQKGVEIGFSHLRAQIAHKI